MYRIKSSIPLLLALVLVACGSSSGGTPSTSTRPASNSTSTPASGAGAAAGGAGDRAGYIAQADQLCKGADARQEALRRRAAGLAVSKLPPILRQQATIAGTLSSALRRLTPPAGDRAVVGRFVGAVQQLSVYSSAVANSIAAGHGFASRSLAAKLRLARQEETFLGRGYGYKICASGKSY